jgi:hypothetical protein
VETHNNVLASSIGLFCLKRPTTSSCLTVHASVASSAKALSDFDSEANPPGPSPSTLRSSLDLNRLLDLVVCRVDVAVIVVKGLLLRQVSAKKKKKRFSFVL